MADWEAPYRAGLTPASKPINAQITIPGSKSATNRALILAAIASTPSRLRKPLTSRDTDLMVKGLKSLGVKIEKIDTNDGFDYEINPSKLIGQLKLKLEMPALLCVFYPQLHHLQMA